LDSLSTELGEEDNPDGLSEEQLRQLKLTAVVKGAPVDAQCEANDQASAWAVQWGADLKEVKQVDWPSDMGTPPAKLMVHAIKKAALTFPADTGLGWDGIHPRAICRLSNDTVEWLVEVTHIMNNHPEGK
jgi:hypothetical protein